MRRCSGAAVHSCTTAAGACPQPLLLGRLALPELRAGQRGGACAWRRGSSSNGGSTAAAAGRRRRRAAAPAPAPAPAPAARRATRRGCQPCAGPAAAHRAPGGLAVHGEVEGVGGKSRVRVTAVLVRLHLWCISEAIATPPTALASLSPPPARAAARHAGAARLTVARAAGLSGRRSSGRWWLARRV